MFSTRIRADWTLPTCILMSVTCKGDAPGTARVPGHVSIEGDEAYLEKLCHFSPLLLGFRAVLLLYHA
jgi:hypothetical protein